MTGLFGRAQEVHNFILNERLINWDEKPDNFGALLFSLLLLLLSDGNKELSHLAEDSLGSFVLLRDGPVTTTYQVQKKKKGIHMCESQLEDNAFAHSNPITKCTKTYHHTIRGACCRNGDGLRGLRSPWR